jgi:hypothetical protein
MRVAIAVLCFVASGCAVTGINEDNMQPDGSYKIEAGGGGGFTSKEAVMDEALERAHQLCPRGYDERSRFCDDKAKTTCIMVVKCK